MSSSLRLVASLPKVSQVDWLHICFILKEKKLQSAQESNENVRKCKEHHDQPATGVFSRFVLVLSS